jgi:hypothetical protein
VTPDLRVALSLWLNAYEDVTEGYSRGAELDQCRRMPALERNLRERSAELFERASNDEEVEDGAPPETAKARARNSPAVTHETGCFPYVVQSNTSFPGVVRALIEWDEAYAALNATDFPTNTEYDRIEMSELALRRFVGNWRRSAVPAPPTIKMSVPPPQPSLGLSELLDLPEPGAVADVVGESLYTSVLVEDPIFVDSLMEILEVIELW